MIDLQDEALILRGCDEMIDGKDLFEYCAEKMGCDYISDLRFLGKEEKVRLSAVIENISKEEAPLFQWNDALCYLAGYGRIATSSAEARSLLLKYLQSGEALREGK